MKLSQVELRLLIEQTLTEAAKKDPAAGIKEIASALKMINKHAVKVSKYLSDLADEVRETGDPNVADDLDDQAFILDNMFGFDEGTSAEIGKLQKIPEAVKAAKQSLKSSDGPSAGKTQKERDAEYDRFYGGDVKMDMKSGGKTGISPAQRKRDAENAKLRPLKKSKPWRPNPANPWRGDATPAKGRK